MAELIMEFDERPPNGVYIHPITTTQCRQHHVVYSHCSLRGRWRWNWLCGLKMRTCLHPAVQTLHSDELKLSCMRTCLSVCARTSLFVCRCIWISEISLAVTQVVELYNCLSGAQWFSPQAPPHVSVMLAPAFGGDWVGVWEGKQEAQSEALSFLCPSMHFYIFTVSYYPQTCCRPDQIKSEYICIQYVWLNLPGIVT